MVSLYSAQACTGCTRFWLISSIRQAAWFWCMCTLDRNVVKELFTGFYEINKWNSIISQVFFNVILTNTNCTFLGNSKAYLRNNIHCILPPFLFMAVGTHIPRSLLLNLNLSTTFLNLSSISVLKFKVKSSFSRT